MRKTSLALVLTLILLQGCVTPTPTPTPSLREVTIAMGYIPNVQFAPFYVAVEKGYFAQEGLMPRFDYGMESDLFKLLGMGQLQFVVGSGDQVILARAQGLPVVYVANWYREFPVCVFSLKGRGLRTPRDLEGKTVGIPGFYGASYIGWKALVYASGLDESRVNLREIGYTQAASVSEGKVDAALGYIVNEPVQLRVAGKEVDVITVSSYFDLVSNGIVTNEKTIAEEPELVKGLVRAFLKGLRYTLEHPDEAFQISLRYIPEISEESKPIQKMVLEEAIKLWEGEPLGHSDPASWEATERFMRQTGLISVKVDVSRAFTNRFVEP